MFQTTPLSPWRTMNRIARVVARRSFVRPRATRLRGLDSFKVSLRGGLSNLIWKVTVLFRVAIHLKFAVLAQQQRGGMAKTDTPYAQCRKIKCGSAVVYCGCLTCDKSIAAVVYDAPSPDKHKAPLVSYRR